MGKRVLLIAVVMALVMFVGSMALASSGIKVVVDGKTLDVTGVRMEGGQLVGPLRVVLEAVGAKVHWDAKNKTVVVTSPSGKSTATPAAKKIEGVVYAPGMGGHLAVANVTIDPTNASKPITVTKLDMIRFGGATDWATHDARVDTKRGVVYSSAYVRDPSGKIRIGYADLKTKQVTQKTVEVSPRYKSGPMYCGSGQSADAFLPVMMGYEGWIDVIDKATLNLRHRVYFDDPSMPKDYNWAHGIESHDGKHFLLSLNGAAAGQGGKPFTDPNLHLYVLEMDALLQGKLKVVKSGTVPFGSASAAFRQAYTPDGKYILQSARDRMLVIDANTLKIVTETMNPEGWENHEFIPVAGSGYGLLLQRVPVKVEGLEKPVFDGKLQLYDIKAGKTVGEPVSVCRSCHDNISFLKDKPAIACGLDATWN